MRMRKSTRRVKKGVVLRHSMDKTAIVQIEKVYSHPKYLKTVRSYKKFSVDDPENIAKIGDIVEIIETRPISKTKFHRVLKVVGKIKLRLRDLPKKKEKEKALSDTAANQASGS